VTTPIPTAGLPAEFYLEGQPTGFARSNLSRYVAGTDNAAAGTGVMHSAAIVLTAGETVTNVTFFTGGTAAGTPTNWWVALYDNASSPTTAPALMAQSADQLTAAAAANTKFTLALATAQRIPVTGVYYVAIMFTATTPPTIRGATTGNAVLSTGALTGSKVLARTSGSGLTGTAPTTIASPTTVATVPWVTLT
jgi:hypothetical protein